MTRLIPARFAMVMALGSLILALAPAPVGAVTPAKLLEIDNPFGGGSPNDGFGKGVAPAGDWNADGYQDLIVGFDTETGTAGRAAIYFGGPNADAIQDVLFYGEGIGDNFGYSVTGLGDFNQDGYDDVAVGAPWHDTNQPDAGAVYVFYGGPYADNLYDLIIAYIAPWPGVLRGYSISSAGDFNGDGIPDLLVGSPDAGPGGQGHGGAEVYLGGSPPNTTVYRVLIVPGPNGETNGGTGISVHEAGDINQDGIGDVIVGTGSSPWLGDDPGRAGIFFGGPSPAPPILFTGEAPFDGFGSAVSGGGDFNGDGLPDVVISAPSNDAVVSAGGRVYVFYNGPVFDTVADLVLTGGITGQGHGNSVSLTTSLDGDLDAELLVGDYFGGNAYALYGGAMADAIAEYVVYTNEVTNAAGIGDFNGDGKGDFAVGRLNDASGAGRVSVYAGISLKVTLPKPGQLVYTNVPMEVIWYGIQAADMYYSSDGGASWSLLRSAIGGNETNRILVRLPAVQTTHARIRLVLAGEQVSMGNFEDSEEFSVMNPWTPPSPVSQLVGTVTGGASGDRLGAAVAFADVNGDGYGDRIVGAPYQDGAGADAGRVTIYLGGPASDDVADVTMSGQAPGDMFGGSVASAGDVNGDGYEDVLIGSKGNDNAGLNTGKADVFLGGPVMDSVADRAFEGGDDGESFGASVAGAGDLNGDGYADIVIGGPLSFSGLARVYFGGRSLDNVPDMVLSGDDPGEQFGSALASGDLNDDGFSDVVVGAPQSGGGSSAGRAYIYFGGLHMDNDSDLKITGSLGSEFGYSVAVADFSGDGAADVAVGARMGNFEVSMGNFESGVSLGNFESGVGYVYFGGPALDDRADVAMQGERTGDQFGFSVAAAGDVNGDRFHDLIIGAPNSAGAGRAYLYLGGPGPDGIPDRVFTGANLGDFFGSSVASAGDTRGDEFADLLIGAQLQGSPSSAGAAQLFDMNRYFVTAPAPGEIWNVGALRTISWRGSEPANVFLSVDGGHTYALLESSVGGAENNSITLRVPHQPSKFAQIKIAPREVSTTGSGKAGNFTIQTSVALLALLAAPAPDGGAGAVVTWRSDPGPEDLAGYRLERATASGPWQTAATLITETRFSDLQATPGTRYRLFAVNGLSEEMLLGETSLPMGRPLAAWPMPYRGGAMNISFATGSGLGGSGATAEVSLYDVRGRLVRTITKGMFRAGYQTVSWDGRDGSGQRVAAGVYFLRAESAGQETTMKLTVLR